MPQEKRPFYVRWRIRDPLYAIFWANVLLIPLGILYYFLAQYGFFLGFSDISGSAPPVDVLRQAMHIFRDDPKTFDAILGMQQLLLWLVLMLMIFRRYQAPVRPFFSGGSVPKDIQNGIKLFGAAIFLNACVVLSVGFVFMFIAGLRADDPVNAVSQYRSGLTKEAEMLLTPDISWTRILWVVLMAPWVEELLFRGCLYGALRQRFSAFWSNAFSSTAFALSHLPVALGLPNLLVIGVLGGWAYERTRSLRVCILFHLLWNLFSTATAKPELWPILIGLVYVLWMWAYRQLKHNNELTERTHIGWKAYAVAFLGVSCFELITGAQSIWRFLFLLPWIYGLLAAAWEKGAGPPAFWGGYAVFCFSWMTMEWWSLWTSPDQRSAWQAALVGFESLGATPLEGLQVMLLSWAWLLPGLIILIRLARGYYVVRSSNKYG